MPEFPQFLARNLIGEAGIALTDLQGRPLAEDPVYRLAHLGDRSRLSCWRGEGVSGGLCLTFAFPAPVKADTWVLDRWFELPGATATLETSLDGGAWSLVDSLPAPIDRTRAHWRSFPLAERRYWRLRLTGLTGPATIFNLWLGRRIELTFAPHGEFDPHEEEVVGEPVHGASGGFHWTQRFRRRVLRAEFRNLTEGQLALLDQWWEEAPSEGRSWWWLSFPQSAPDDPLYLNCEGLTRRFALSRTVRNGVIEAREVR